MAIVASDLLYKLSVTTGSAGNSTAQASGDASLGKYISTTQVSASLHALFDAVTGVENAASAVVDYRCIFVHNAHGSLSLTSVKAYISAEVSGGVVCAIGLDPAGVTAIGSSSAQAATAASQTSAPAGVTFTSPTTYAGGLSIADIPAGSCAAIWIRRTSANTSALNADGVTIKVEGDTAA